MHLIDTFTYEGQPTFTSASRMRDATLFSSLSCSNRISITESLQNQNKNACHTTVTQLKKKSDTNTRKIYFNCHKIAKNWNQMKISILPNGSFDMQDFLSIQRIIHIRRRGWTLQRHTSSPQAVCYLNAAPFSCGTFVSNLSVLPKDATTEGPVQTMCQFLPVDLG